jgi:GNAT superfamily N-acetyltransferase
MVDAAKPIVIREGCIEDAEAIHAALLGIAETVGELHKMTSTADDIRRHGFGLDPAFRTLIAEVNGAFAGICLYFPSFSTWKGHPGVYVQDLYVADVFRGMGIGARLMRRLAWVTREAGGRYIRLAVDTRNFPAQRFYDGLGLTHSDTEQIHAAYGAAFDALADAERDGT